MIKINPIFVILVIAFAVLIWFLLAFLYPVIGKIFYRIWKGAVDEINKNDDEEREEKKDER